MITIARVDHISMAHPDWKGQTAWLQRVLGFRFLRHAPAEPGEDFDWTVSLVPGTDVAFEVITPSTPESFVQRFLDNDGPGLHHITLEVPDVPQAAEELRRLGVEPFGGVTEEVTYIHPRDSGGILYQLYRPHGGSAAPERQADGGVTGVKRMDHVSMAVPDLDRQIDFQERVFGMQVKGRWTDSSLGYHGAILSIPNSRLEFEIIAPSRPDSFVQKFIEERRPGMHHICCEVQSVEAAAEGLKREGIEPFGGVIRNVWKPHTFIHPRDSGGVLFQLFEESRPALPRK